MTTATATDRVPCAPLAAVFERSDLTAHQVCQAMGWTDVSCRQASSKVRRALGLKRTRNGAGEYRYRESLPYELAVKFARALEIDPVEVGL